MEDPQLNKSLEETKELQTRWNQFREFVRMAIERGKVTPEAEMKFLELKSYIAILHDGFMSKLTHDQKVGQAIMSIVGDCIMLARIANYNDAEKQKFEFDWNECYLLISEQTQGLMDEKQRLAGVSARSYKASKRKERLQAQIYNFIHSAGLKYSIILLCLIFLLYVVPAHIWSYRNFVGVPGLNKVYRAVANKIYRPFLDKEYAYDTLEDVNLNPNTDVDPPVPRISKQDGSQLTQAYFENELYALGLDRAAQGQAVALMKTPGFRFDSERFQADAMDANFFYLFFTTTDDARKFADLIVAAFSKLPGNMRTQVVGEFYIMRSANFVAIGRSKHGMREGHIQGKLGLSEPPKNLIAF
jgi:hypothetical protein